MKHDMPENIRIARKKRSMTQAELAEKIGVQRSVISKYESGMVSPSFSQIQKIAEALNVDIIYLLDGYSQADYEKALHSYGEKVSAPQSEKVSDEDIKFALFEGAPVTDEQFEEVKRFAKYVRDRDKFK